MTHARASASAASRPEPGALRPCALAALLIAVLMLTFGAPVAIAAQPATLSYPTNGAQLVDANKPFTWNSVQSASGYWLWVGTSPGANDLVNSKTLTTTSYLARNLPPGR